MSDTSTNLAFPYLAAGQAQKHVTVNESLQRLDAIVQLAVVSASTSAEPGSPSDGQVYILPAGKTGTHWGAMTDLALAYYRDGAWEEITPREGFSAYVKDTDEQRLWDGSAWNLAADAAGAVQRVGDVMTGALQVAYTPASGNDPVVEALVTSPASSQSPVRIRGTGMSSSGLYYNILNEKSSPAANDILGGVQARGLDSASAAQLYGNFQFRAGAVTAGAHTGYWELAVRRQAVNQTIVLADPDAGLCVGGLGTSASTSNPSVRANRHHALRSYALASLPSQQAGDAIWCSDLGGGAGQLNSDGTNWKRLREHGYANVSSNANFTLTWLTDAPDIRHTGTLTADRTITLSTTNAYAGARFRITRTGSGAFNLSVGGLKNLATNTWCEVCYDGSAWFLAAYGAL